MNINRNGIYYLTKMLLQIGLLILFIGGFIKIYMSLANGVAIKILFISLYSWCTIGINVNLMIPLIKKIDEKARKRN
tara:strand:+ start:620 stop:850 length:231 start_codon:yes stop_codon:yes gene_type:complete